MTTHIKVSLNLYWLFFIALAASICATEIWIINSTFFVQNPGALAFGITFDLVIGIPALYYVLVIRKKRAPAITVIPITIWAYRFSAIHICSFVANSRCWCKDYSA